MANQEQLDLLKRDVKQWNEWREQHLSTLPDLIGADLRGANLYRANLYRANLVGADLSWSILHETNLRDLDLFTAKGLTTIKHRGRQL